ncbi:FAS1-like dehydratase domain-containing protein [Paraburkholderia phytofirmans]|uniref:FAS1-like dehydratase domain-containing protein n=1 Tax=Paraburkholderia phytofirmans TaxID=261302 RepID=UPI0038BD56E9
MLDSVTSYESVEVEKGRLLFFAKAIGETYSVYTYMAAARATGRPSLPVPPTFSMYLSSEISPESVRGLCGRGAGGGRYQSVDDWR